jgi:hypothetical protein
MIGPNSPRLCWVAIRQARVRKVKIEARIWRDERDFGARAGLEPFLGEAAYSGSLFATRKPGKLSVLESRSSFESLNLNSLPCLRRMRGPGITPS